MKRLICIFAMCVSMVGILVGCQEQEVPKAEPAPPAPVEVNKGLQPSKTVEQQPIQQEEKATVQAESQPKESAPAPVQAKKPVEVAKSVPSPAAPTPPPSAAVKKEADPEPPKQQMVTLSITGDEQLGTILSATQVAIEEGDTVLDVLKKATKEKKIPMEYSGSEALAYVEGIDNLYEFDRGPKSGWVYRVNGVMGKKSAGDIALKPNDRIEWLYTLDLGKDLE